MQKLGPLAIGEQALPGNALRIADLQKIQPVEDHGQNGTGDYGFEVRIALVRSGWGSSARLALAPKGIDPSDGT